MTRLSPKNYMLYLIVAGFIVLIQPLLPKEYQALLLPPTPSPTIRQPDHATMAKVKRVVDGDTIELETGEHLRYIGIDSPETKHPKKPVQCYGEEAYQENKKLIEGKTIRMVKDVSEVDKYKRLLRYVYIATPASPSGILINDYLVRNGFAFAVTFPPDVAMAQQLRLAEREAREKNLGMWKSCSIVSKH